MDEKPLHWIASAKKDLMFFPACVIDSIGYALGVIQEGGHPPSAKSCKGAGQGVFELVEDDRSRTYRLIYAVRFPKVIYVLHAFQKKSPSGVRTARTDVTLVTKRLQLARRHYEERYGTQDGKD